MSPAGSPAETIDRVVGEVEGLQVRHHNRDSRRHGAAVDGAAFLIDEPVIKGSAPALIPRALNLEDLELGNLGLILTIRRSKTDQAGIGRKLGISRSRKGTCPVAALERWLETGGIAAGPVFTALDRGQTGDRLSGQAIAHFVKRAVLRVGLDPARYAGHSLRSGFATSAARGGADLSFVMLQTGHPSAYVARRYIQQGRLSLEPSIEGNGTVKFRTRRTLLLDFLQGSLHNKTQQT